MSEQTVRESGAEFLVAEVPYADLDRAVIDRRSEGLFMLIVSQANHRILGAHAAGDQALEIVQIVASGMTADMWVEQLAEFVTLSGLLRRIMEGR
ncbi:MAG: hypothetical protein ACE5JF_03465 [Anaerolineales bacterium]